MTKTKRERSWQRQCRADRKLNRSVKIKQRCHGSLFPEKGFQRSSRKRDCCSCFRVIIGCFASYFLQFSVSADGLWVMSLTLANIHLCSGLQTDSLSHKRFISGLNNLIIYLVLDGLAISLFLTVLCCFCLIKSAFLHSSSHTI